MTRTAALSEARPIGRRLFRSRRFGFIAAALLVVALVLGLWLHERSQHVYANDARVASHVVAVSSEVSGRLIELRVRPGQRVRRGQLLARIEPRDIQFSIAETDASIANLEAQQRQLRAQQSAIRTRVGRETDVSAAGVTGAEADRGVRQAELVAARRAFERTRALFERGFVSRSRYDEDQARLRAAEESAERAQAQIASARAGVGVTASGADQIAVLEQQIAALEAQKQGLAAERRQQQLNLGRTEIRAAFDGVIDQTFVDAGEFVAPGTRILMYHDPNDVWIDVNVKETEFRKLALGAPAIVEVDAYPGRAFEARVAELGGAATSQFALLPNPNPSGNFTKVTQRLPVRLELRQRDGLLRPGMMVEATIDVVG